ncbi:hypothetical protein D3871_07190 [Noviherbaspirillum saxi]|uniref:Uncharacterized protein n=1 Tax=Noviherbaspirillum saxi TaxID=2320863 RepID=A0A3A3FQ42_9BURK|nr:hypothetical protein D3871_07190 [Noviherbaspirillum saxi]
MARRNLCQHHACTRHYNCRPSPGRISVRRRDTAFPAPPHG